jgi:DnaJ-class molecular chaperone
LTPPEEIDAAFEKLRAEFQDAGKPKNIDDVEWLRQLVKAHEVLSNPERRRNYESLGRDLANGVKSSSGYDFAEVRRISDAMDSQLKAQRIKRLVWWVLQLFR